VDPSLRVGRNKFIQAAYVVDDIDAAMERWLKFNGLGPFFIIRHAKMQDLRYRGRPVEVDASFAMAQAGGIQIELCAQHNEGPSCYRDMFAPGEEGFHHMCSVTHDYETELAHFASLGCPPAMEGRFGEMRFAYVDTRPLNGFMTEIIEDWEPVRLVHQQVADAARDWDGSDPIRLL
jgi:hypothetical protein